jgi:hypothetical protein
LLVDGNYSIKVLDSQGSQVYYLENAFNGDPVTVENTVTVFGTVADMVADTTLFVGQSVACLDYAASHNSGVLFFKVVASATGTADGGKYIDLTGSGHQAEANFPTILSVRAYGAAPVASDGDNDTAIANAIAYLKTQGGRLHAPAGIYQHSATIDFTDAVNNNPIMFTGDGRVSTKFQHTATTGTALRARPDSCQIANMTIEGAGSGTADGILLQDTASSGPKNATLFDVQVKDFVGGSGVINDGFANAFYGLFINNCNVGFEDRGSGGHTNLTHGFIDGCLTYGVEITGPLVHMAVNSMNIENCPTGFFSGASAAGVGNVVFTSCHFEGNTDRDIRLGNGTHDCIVNGGRLGGTNSRVQQSIFHAGDATTKSRIYINGPEWIDEGTAANTELINAGQNVQVIFTSLEAIGEGIDSTNVTLGTDAYLVMPGLSSLQQPTITHTSGGALAIDWSLGSYVQIDLESDITNLTCTNMIPGKEYTVRFRQQNGGGWTVATGSSFRANGGLNLNLANGDGTMLRWIGISTTIVELVSQGGKYQAYTTATFTPDRAVSNTATITTQELGDVLSTLIDDLKTRNILG